MKKSLLAYPLLLLTPLAAHAACPTSDFAVVNFEMTKAGDRIGVKGQLVNHCAESAGVQIAIEAKDAGGKVLASKKVWPAGTTNIPAGASVDLDLRRLFRYTPDLQTLAVSAVSVRNW